MSCYRLCAGAQEALAWWRTTKDCSFCIQQETCSDLRVFLCLAEGWELLSPENGKYCAPLERLKRKEMGSSVTHLPACSISFSFCVSNCSTGTIFLISRTGKHCLLINSRMANLIPVTPVFTQRSNVILAF